MKKFGTPTGAWPGVARDTDRVGRRRCASPCATRPGLRRAAPTPATGRLGGVRAARGGLRHRLLGLPGRLLDRVAVGDLLWQARTAGLRLVRSGRRTAALGGLVVLRLGRGRAARRARRARLVAAADDARRGHGCARCRDGGGPGTDGVGTDGVGTDAVCTDGAPLDGHETVTTGVCTQSWARTGKTAAAKAAIAIALPMSRVLLFMPAASPLPNPLPLRRTASDGAGTASGTRQHPARGVGSSGCGAGRLSPLSGG